MRGVRAEWLVQAEKNEIYAMVTHLLFITVLSRKASQIAQKDKPWSQWAVGRDKQESKAEAGVKYVNYVRTIKLVTWDKTVLDVSDFLKLYKTLNAHTFVVSIVTKPFL